MKTSCLLVVFGLSCAYASTIKVFGIPKGNVQPPPPGGQLIQGNAAVSVQDVKGKPALPTISDIKDKPLIVVIKAEGFDDALESHLIQGGLKTLSKTPSTKYLFQALQSDVQQAAFLFHPLLFDIADFKIGNKRLVKFVLPQDILFSDAARLYAFDLPMLLVGDAEELMKFQQGLQELGKIEVKQDTVTVEPLATAEHVGAK